MKKIITKRGLSLVALSTLTVVLGYASVYAWNGLTTSTGDSLTATKWNELVDKISGIHTNENGRVGVGIETPTAQLNIHKNGQNLGIEPGYNGKTYIQSYIGTGVFAPLSIDATELNLRTFGANPIIFKTNSTERARIDLNGNIGIGTTSPDSELDVGGEISTSYNPDEALKMRMISGSKTVATGEWVELFRVGHTVSGDINIIALNETGTPGTSSITREFSFSNSYGISDLQLEQETNNGKGIVSNAQLQYANTGGSEHWIMKVYVTSSQSTSKVHWSWDGISSGSVYEL